MSNGNTFAGTADEYIAKLEAEGKAILTVAKTQWLLTKLSQALGTRSIAEVSPQGGRGATTLDWTSRARLPSQFETPSKID